ALEESERPLAESCLFGASAAAARFGSNAGASVPSLCIKRHINSWPPSQSVLTKGVAGRFLDRRKLRSQPRCTLMPSTFPKKQTLPRTSANAFDRDRRV